MMLHLDGHTGDLHGLTELESEILRLVARGFTNPEIVRIVGPQYITEDMVKYRVGSGARKLGARNRAHAVTRGFEVGILSFRVTPEECLTEEVA
jgi:DNA-binding CsgD family transcriptional regulator